MKQKYYLLLLTISISCLGFANTDKDSLLVKSTKKARTQVSSPRVHMLDTVIKNLIKDSKPATNTNQINTSNIGEQFRSFQSLNEYNTSINAPTSPF